MNTEYTLEWDLAIEDMQKEIWNTNVIDLLVPRTEPLRRYKLSIGNNFIWPTEKVNVIRLLIDQN